MQKQILMPGQTEILAVATTAPVVCFRVPKPKSTDPFFGAARTFWNQRVLRTKANKFKPDVLSYVVKQPGARRGVRFIDYQSACDYFNKLRANQQPQPQ